LEKTLEQDEDNINVKFYILNSELSKLSPQRMTETSNFTHT